MATEKHYAVRSFHHGTKGNGAVHAGHHYLPGDEVAQDHEHFEELVSAGLVKPESHPGVAELVARRTVEKKTKAEPKVETKGQKADTEEKGETKGKGKK